MNSDKKFKTIEEYILMFPRDVQATLQTLRKAILEETPGGEETISYQMPTIKLNGKYIAYFAAWKHHIGFYPTPGGITAFEKELAPYAKAKGSVQFPLDKPLPLDLIRKIIKARVKEAIKK